MSRLLVKKALNLFRDDFEVNSLKQRGRTKVLTEKDVKTKKLPSKLVKRAKKCSKKQPHQQKLKSSVSDLKMKSVVEEVKRNSNRDNTEDNVRLLQQISKPKAAEVKAVDLIIENHKGRKAKDLPSISKRKAREKSVFTEEDFKNFEESYFLRS